MLEGVSPFFLRVSKYVLICLFFVSLLFTGSNDVEAANIPPVINTPPPGGNLLPDPFAGAAPGMTPAPTRPPVLTLPDGTLVGGLPPSNPGSPSTPGGADGGGEGNPGATPADNAAGPGEEPVVQVVSDCSESFFASFNCMIINFFGSFVAIAGLTFDTAVGLFIIQFGDQYLTTNLGVTVESLWGTVRDIFNLTFIFGLVYIGFQIILGTNESQAKRTIPLLIIAGLLVNFSLFIVKFIVDFANLAAYQIYSLFSSIGSNAPSMVATPEFLEGLPSISTAFLNALGVGRILSVVAVNQEYLYLLGLLVIFAVLIYVFFMGAILITIRFAVLLMYIVFSPVMFLGWVFPGLQGITDKYWRGLLGQAFFAPALLFMLYLSYRIIDGYNATMRASLFEINNGLVNSGGNAEGATASQGELVSSFVEIMPFFVMVVVFLIASMIVARKMADSGGSMVMKINNYGIGKLNGALVGAGVGAGAFAYRNTGGRMSKYAMDKMDQSGASNVPLIGRGLRNTFKSGYEFGAGGTSLAKKKSERESYEADVIKNRSRLQSERDNKAGMSKVEAANKSLTALEALRARVAAGQTLTDAEQADMFRYETEQAEASKFITGLGKSDIEDMSSKDRVANANRFSADQVTKILESDKISGPEKNQIVGARVARVTAKVNGGGTVPTPGQTTKLNQDEISTLGVDWVSQNAHLLSPSQFDEYIKNNKKLTPEIVDILKKRRNTNLLTEIENDTATAKSLLKELAKKPTEFAQLPTEIFTETKYKPIIPFLTVGTLEEIAQKGKLDQAQRFAMRAYLSAPGRGTPTQLLAYFASDEGKKKYGP